MASSTASSCPILSADLHCNWRCETCQGWLKVQSTFAQWVPVLPMWYNKCFFFLLLKDVFDDSSPSCPSHLLCGMCTCLLEAFEVSFHQWHRWGRATLITLYLFMSPRKEKPKVWRPRDPEEQIEQERRNEQSTEITSAVVALVPLLQPPTSASCKWLWVAAAPALCVPVKL